ncbi:MAG: Hydrolase or acyltransferase [Candidatus Tokpelaia sp. JSC189]|nr:MAG: Hydrolase or acyltransferase [Candidatus Tokpelaia sp. JSC189]
MHTGNNMQFFYHDGFRLAFQDDGQGEPILLIHGFASSILVNWVASNWFKTLVDAGYRVIAIDNRGHGYSSKSYNPAAYTLDLMADDAAALLRYLRIEKAHIMGYSMGAKIAAFIALRTPKMVHTLVFGGLGIGMVRGRGDWEAIAKALLAEDPATITDPYGLIFRKFADNTKSDRKALAACIITSREELKADEVHCIIQPVLVAVGTKDAIAGEPQPLVALLPNGEILVIPDRDHMLAVGDKIYKKGVLKFLERHSMHKVEC